MTKPPDFESWSCPLPVTDHPRIVLGHGSGGALSAELIEQIFLPAFRNPVLEQMSDAAVVPHGGGRLAFSTDSYVVRPLFFPGGCIGDLAVNGTVNDLAMVGAQPQYLSASFILEEGFPIETLSRIVQAMAAAARHARVDIVTGDTKVVERGHGDGCYITTAGIGFVDPSVHIGPTQIRPGDAILLSGTLADHGMAIMSLREGLQFESVIASDSAPLHTCVQQMLGSGAKIHALRDPTRGGLAATLTELAAAAQVGVMIDESAIPINPVTQGACELLGLDPLFVANEGKLVAFVDAADAEMLLAVMKQHPLGQESAIIGTVTEEHRGTVVARTPIGGKRVVTRLVGEQLPRIC